MPKCVFDRATNFFVSGVRWGNAAHDPVTHIQIELPEFPDPVAQRWDGGTGVRDATAQEIADFDEYGKIGKLIIQ